MFRFLDLTKLGAKQTFPDTKFSNFLLPPSSYGGIREVLSAKRSHRPLYLLQKSQNF